MQKELNLTTEQAKSVYEINLKYARERKQSNRRSDAVTRIKSKNEEIGKVLNDRQTTELQSKRSEVQSVEIDGKRRFTRTDAMSRANDESYQNSDTKTRVQDRPVRTDRSTRQSQPATSDRSRSSDQINSRPVRQNENNRDADRSTVNRGDVRQNSSYSGGYNPSGSPVNSSSTPNNRSSSDRNSDSRSNSGASSASRSSSNRSGR